MTVSKKSKQSITESIKQNKSQYDVDEHTAKISALSSGNFG